MLTVYTTTYTSTRIIRVAPFERFYRQVATLCVDQDSIKQAAFIWKDHAGSKPSSLSSNFHYNSLLSSTSPCILHCWSSVRLQRYTRVTVARVSGRVHAAGSGLSQAMRCGTSTEIFERLSPSSWSDEGQLRHVQVCLSLLILIRLIK